MKVIVDIKEFLVDFISQRFKTKYDGTYPNQKYSLEEIIEGIIHILQTGISYNKYQEINGKIHGKTLNRHFLFFKENNVFQNAYMELLEKYFKKNKTEKLKYQFLDSTFIVNKYNARNVGRNKFYKGKRGIKLSCITEKNGIPISILVDKGNKADSDFVENHFQNMLILTNSENYKNHNRYKQYFCADKGYSTKKVNNLLTLKGYVPIIPFNKRNTRDKAKIRHLNDKQKKIYRKRIKIENLFSWMKHNGRLDKLMEKSMESYLSYAYLGFIKIILKKM